MAYSPQVWQQVSAAQEILVHTSCPWHQLSFHFKHCIHIALWWQWPHKWLIDALIGIAARSERGGCLHHDIRCHSPGCHTRNDKRPTRQVRPFMPRLEPCELPQAAIIQTNLESRTNLCQSFPLHVSKIPLFTNQQKYWSRWVAEAWLASLLHQTSFANRCLDVEERHEDSDFNCRDMIPTTEFHMCRVMRLDPREEVSLLIMGSQKSMPFSVTVRCSLHTPQHDVRRRSEYSQGRRLANIRIHLNVMMQITHPSMMNDANLVIGSTQSVVGIAA